MQGSSAFNISGFRVQIRDLDEPCAEMVRDVWSLFLDDGQSATIDVLDVTVRFAGDELRGRSISERPLRREIDGDSISFVSAEGEIDLAPDGRAEARVGQGSAAIRAFSLINLLLPALSWRLPRHGALMLHSGAVLLDGRGWVLIGQAGAGKSTFVRFAEKGGATVVSEDLNLLTFEGDSCSLAGAPFRTRNYPGPGPGRWPLAALLLPHHAPEPALTEMPRLAVSAQFQANLPFVGDCWMQVPGAAALLERIDRLTARRLSYAPDDSFVPLLRTFAAD
jgi:hypothetical protein